MAYDGDGRCVLGFTSDKSGGPIKKWESKLFGSPIWQDEQSAPCTPVICGICGSKMLMVCQLYSPVEGLERSLYAFVCPIERCSLCSSGWKVIRNQSHSNSNSNSNSNSSAGTTSSSSKSESSASSSATKLPAVPKAKTAVLSDWSLDDDDDDDDLSELMGMISAREQKAKGDKEQGALLVPPPPPPPLQPQTQPQTHPQSATSGGSVASSKAVSLVVTPEWRLWDDSTGGGEVEVPAAVISGAPGMGGPAAPSGQHQQHRGEQADESEGAYIRGEDDEDEDEDADDGCSGAGGHDRIIAMLNSYAEDPENASLVAELKTSLSKKKGQDQRHGQGVASSGPTKSRAAVDLNAAYMYPTKAVVQGGAPNSTASSGASKQLQNYRLRLEGYFHRRVAYHPQQVLRYGYGLQPLWCSVLFRDMFPTRGGSSAPVSAPANSSSQNSGNKKKDPAVTTMDQLVPCCQGCGAARVFEFQLMPALLSKYAQCRLAIDSTASASAAGVGVGDVGSAAIGLEFGVVCVFVCPNSCTHKGCWEECAIVQPPSDLIAN